MTPIAPTDVACPFCGAPVGKPCVAVIGSRAEPRSAHHSRIYESNKQFSKR